MRIETITAVAPTGRLPVGGWTTYCRLAASLQKEPPPEKKDKVDNDCDR